MIVIDLPNATSMLSSLGAYSGPIFTEFLPLILALTGLVVGALILRAIASWVIVGVSGLIHRDKDKFDF